MRVSALVWLGGLVAFLPSACVYDPDDRCGPHQVQFVDDRCACEPGYVPGESGCVPCGEHEVEQNGACICDEGYARATNDVACEPIPAELGAECDAEEALCESGKYTLCHAVEGTSGYCTNSCSTDADCDGGYRCHEDGADGYCRRPPLGYGDSCDSDDDCRGEATLCEKVQAHTCFVPCGPGDTAGCFEGEVCCNVVIYTMCLPADACAENGVEVK